ncbi:MAG: hypothetical protein JXB13_12165 [Phycisphaerae bacterium]|nr:hypothetical protein [Phycisphaerae bacterium]
MFSRLLFRAELPTWALFLELGLAAVIVILSGTRLTRLADRLAEEYHLGRAWVGMLLLATVTSLPEVVTACTSVVIGAPDLAFATILGSCSFNITLIVWFNIAVGGGSVLCGRNPVHVLTGTRGIFMIALTLVGIALSQKYQTDPWVAGGCEIAVCLVIVFTYLQAIRATYLLERAAAPLSPSVVPATRTQGLVGRIVGFSAALAVAAWWSARTGDVLSVHPIGLLGRPLGATFVGAAFLAVSTSLPEIVTGLAAVRMGQMDLALGNIFGSNMFNVFVLPMCKATSLACGHPLLMAGAAFHPDPNLLAGLLPILLTAVAIGGLTAGPRGRILGLGPDSVAIAVFYVAGMTLLLAGA